MWKDEMVSRITDILVQEVSADENEEPILKIKVRNALETVIRTRNYKTSHTDSFIRNDISKYETNIHDLALYDFNQIGAEGQNAHSESGYNRSWHKREDCLLGIFPFL